MDDVRVILVKLADRLHNMRTLQFLRRDRQVAIARETLEIYAPIANRLGIGAIKGELEDLCFRYLHPAEAERLEREVEERTVAAERWFARIQTEIVSLLDEHGVKASVKGRVKHLYSIYLKLRRQGIDVSNVFDFLAFRVIVDTVTECYATLGLIHQKWSPLPGRIKDHIAIPKPNAYQSLHTTVIGPEGHPFEIQIRTLDMNKIAEFGIAAHWNYKEQGSGAVAGDSRISWLRSLMSDIEGSSPREFLDSLKVDLYPDEVYCFTPRGDVFSFPSGATILDFAYRVHTEVGHHCVGGRVNGRWVPIKTGLTNGDIVEITTSPQQAPHHGWLDHVVTNRARSKIRSWLKREEKERAVEVGRKLLDRELRKLGASTKKALAGEPLQKALSVHGLAQEDDLLAAIGFGRLSASVVAGELRPPAEGAAAPAPRTERVVPTPRESAVLEVSGDADFLVYVAKCCNPLPGEEIVGYVTRGKGVAVHSRECPNVKKLLYHPEREIEVRWSSEAGRNRESAAQVDLDMSFRDRPGMLAAISERISSEGCNIVSCRMSADDTKTGQAAMTIAVRDASQLNRVLEKLNALDGMLQVDRRGAPTRARA